MKSILYAAFNGPNLICHIAGTILNIAAIENSDGSFNLFRNGISPGVINLLEQLWEEKKSVFDVFGFQPAPSVRECSREYNIMTRFTTISVKWMDREICFIVIYRKMHRC
ncbi:MAG: NAD/NADP octopine/nopaline dehydrogenase family protein [Enterocloster sp.]